MSDRHSFSSSAFSPAAARQTSVAFLRNVGTGDHRLVTSISTRKSTEVLRINLRTGRLELENDRWAESSYENESEALDHLQGRGYEVVERGYALLGYAVAGPTAGLLLGTRVREKAVLPGGHTVFAVTDSQWTMVPLQNEASDAAAAAALGGLPPPKAVVAAQEFWRVLQQFTLNNAHYYCETADISRPFPSDRDPRDPNSEFVWNSWLRQPLVELGLYDHCPVLLQGAVECSTQALPGGSRFSMCLISRRSRRHPGTRYIARGLNSMAGPGNEIECELVTWTHPEQRLFGGGGGGGIAPSSTSQSRDSLPEGSRGSFTTTSFSAVPGGAAGEAGGSGEALRWARVVWRRGTVPIWWGVQLQSLAQGLQAEVFVREEHPYQGTASYFRNVQRQHAPRPAVPTSPGGQQRQGAAAGAAAGEPGSGGGGSGAASEGWTLVDDAAASAAGTTGSSQGAMPPAASPQQPAGQRAAQQAGQQQQACAALSEEERSQAVAVTCINLLHANPKKASELMLSSHFQDAMRHVRRRLGGAAPISVVNFDWHGNMGRLTEEKAVEGFWSLMEPFVKQTGFAAGWMEPEVRHLPQRRTSPHPSSPNHPSSPAAAAGSSSSLPVAAAAAAAAAADAVAAVPATSWPPGWRMRWTAQQSGLLRFNCADSLDRTNAATCFAVLPLLQEQLRVLGLALECGMPPGTAALLRSRQRASAGDVSVLAQQAQAEVLEAAAGGLPEGWEVRQHEGRLLYIDHVNKVTQWTPPSPGAPPASASASASSRPGSRPGSGAPLSSRVMQSASDMLARLQQRSASGQPISSSGGSIGGSIGSIGGGGGIGGGGSGSPGKGTMLQHLERRSSPPRMPTAEVGGGSGSSGSGGNYYSRNSSSGSLSGGGGANNGVSHAVSAPDVTLAGTGATAAGTEAPSSPGVGPERDPRRPWAFFGYDINDVRERLHKDAVSDYVEMFRVHGDIHSFLYTGSPAMHSHVLNLVVQGGKGYGATSGVGKLQNLRVAVQRRWNNTMSDASRQQAMELFLGLRIHDAPDCKGYFPGLQVVYRDSTQPQLGGMEAFESLPLPPSHSRHVSASGPLGAGTLEAAAAAAAAAASATLERLPELLEEEGEQRAGAATAGAEAAESEEEDDRAHAVPGVPAVEHDGVLGVRESLFDLEPLPGADLSLIEEQLGQQPEYQPPRSHSQQYQQQQQRQQYQPQQDERGWHSPAHNHSVSVETAPGSLSQHDSAVAVGGTPPLPAFDPLGALLHPLPGEQQQLTAAAALAPAAAPAAEEGEELISFGSGGTQAQVAAGVSPVCAQLRDLLSD